MQGVSRRCVCRALHAKNFDQVVNSPRLGLKVWPVEVRRVRRDASRTGRGAFPLSLRPRTLVRAAPRGARGHDEAGGGAEGGDRGAGGRPCPFIVFEQQ